MGTAAHPPSFNPHPLAALAAAFAGGAALAFFIPTQQFAPPLAVGALASASATFFWLRKRHGRATAALVVACAGAGAALAAVERLPPRESRLRSFYETGRIESGDPVELTGVVERAPESAPDGLFFALRAERIRARGAEHACSGRVELSAPARDSAARAAYDALELRRGARLRVAVRLTRAGRYRNPGVETSGDYLERRGADARGTIKSALLVERLDEEPVLLPLYWLDGLRRHLIKRTSELFAVEAAGVLRAALFGDRHGLTRETAERFRDGGTFHILVVSGMHVTLIGGLVWAGARLVTRRRPWQWLASAAGVWGFALAVGAESSVVRAALMFSAATFAPVTGRRSGALNALGGAALALLVWRPSYLLDPSFQLTFLSVLAIVAVAAPLLSRLREVGEWRPARATPCPPACPSWFKTCGEILHWRERQWLGELARATHSYRLFKTPWAARLERARAQTLLRYVFSILLVSVVVQAVLLPLLVVYFHRLPLAAPLLNVWVGLLLAAGCVAALAALLFDWLGLAALTAALAHAADAATRLAARGVDPFAAARVASLRVPEYTGAASAVYALYFAPLAALTFALLHWRPLTTGTPETKEEERNRRRKRINAGAAVALAALGAVIVLHPLSAPRTGGRLRVDFLDVGQGDAALVTLPDGTTLLIDGGGQPDFGGRAGADDAAPASDARGVGDRVVSEFLWHRGLSRVNFVLATHADADHIGGLADVLANFRADAALVGRAPARDPDFARFAAAAEKSGVPVYSLTRGGALRFGEAIIEVLWPPAPGDARAVSGNDASVVLRLRFGRRAVLLTGDVEAGAESALAAGGGESLACDVLKVAHHGSRTSSTEKFLAAARPALAVVPVGLDSPHGHPHPEAVARLRAAGARVLTTGESGTITITTDGADLSVETFVKQ